MSEALHRATPIVGSVWMVSDPNMSRRVAMVGVDGSNRPIIMFWRGNEADKRSCLLHAWHRWVQDNKAVLKP
jgi:hypothetical protein